MAQTRRKGELSTYERETVTFLGKARDIYRKGSGPAVIVMAEIPGITPKVIGFADRLVDEGFTAVMPHLFGEPGGDLLNKGMPRALPGMVKLVVPLCVSKEFTALASGKTSKTVEWLRELAMAEHARCGGPGVGAVGMCFTGGYALAMSTIPELVAPVLSQPSLPFVTSKKKAAGIDISDKDLAVVQDRCAAGNLEVVGLRFKGDRLVPASRFRFLKEKLGDAFIAVELDDDQAHPKTPMPPHSVLTEHLVDVPGNQTHDALQLVLEHFRKNLTPA